MPGFLYFVPEVTSPQQAEDALKAAGAAHATERHPQYNQVTGGTLFGAPGYLVGWGTNYLLKPDDQEWQKAVVLIDPYEGPGYWIGWQKDSPPGPEDLARETQLPGHFVELADGNRWLVPVARRYTAAEGTLTYEITLPSVRRLTPDGRWRCDAVEQSCRRLWELVCLLDRYIAGDEDAKKEFDLDAETELVVESLRLNYHIGAAELSLRDLLVTKSVCAVVEAVTDKPSLELLVREQGKKAPASGEVSTSPGGGD